MDQWTAKLGKSTSDYDNATAEIGVEVHTAMLKAVTGE